MATIFQ